LANSLKGEMLIAVSDNLFFFLAINFHQ